MKLWPNTAPILARVCATLQATRLRNIEVIARIADVAMIPVVSVGAIELLAMRLSWAVREQILNSYGRAACVRARIEVGSHG
jgi:hypothetical protein